MANALASLGTDQTVDVWIAAGTYVPAAAGAPVTSHFALRSGLALYGGFAGDERSLDERDPVANPTILSGDLAGNDIPHEIGLWLNDAENARQVVRAIECDETARLDGLTIRRGEAVSTTTVVVDRGANVSIEDGSPTIVDCIVENAVSDWGGAAYVLRGSPRFERCVFRGNRGATTGGGMLIEGDAVLVLRDCRFEANFGGQGAGLFAGSIGGQAIPGSPSVGVERCEFIANTGPIGSASGIGIGTSKAHLAVVDSRFVNNITVGGGGGAFLSESSAHFVRCDFVGNRADGDGGGALAANGIEAEGHAMVCIDCRFVGNNGVAVAAIEPDNDGMPPVRFANCTMVANSPQRFGWPLLVTTHDGAVLLSGSIVQNHLSVGEPGLAGVFVGFTPNGYVLRRSLIENWDGSMPGEEVSDLDPMFVDASGADGIAGTEDDDLRLSPGSPAIDQGDLVARSLAWPSSELETDVAMTLTLDLDELERFHDDVGTPDQPRSSTPAIDLGAHEFQGESPTRGCAGDLDRDGEVAGSDLAILLGAWGTVGRGAAAADLDGDGVVGGADLAILLGAWGACEG
ncbi:MAG: right-handed parallel beta-helix repeat-containing protein [Phycisphaerae bacterium]|nr:right-handed parallel beta-helix repeat-containing protein [Phycisphaerae bacterium]